MNHTITTAGRTQDARHQLSCELLRRENRQYRGTGGVSRGNRSSCFVPAFQDVDTGVTYRSRFADGSPAPMHILEGLPAHVLARTGDVVKAGQNLISGFLRNGIFYTRAQAAAAIQQCGEA